MANGKDAPFIFGVQVEGDTFTDRKEETARLLAKKDLIESSAPKHLAMSDPILALWLKKRVWKES